MIPGHATRPPEVPLVADQDELTPELWNALAANVNALANITTGPNLRLVHTDGGMRLELYEDEG